MNKVLCIKPAHGLEVGKIYEVEFDLYDLIHVNGQGYGRDKFEYVGEAPPTPTPHPSARSHRNSKI